MAKFDTSMFDSRIEYYRGIVKQLNFDTYSMVKTNSKSGKITQYVEDEFTFDRLIKERSKTEAQINTVVKAKEDYIEALEEAAKVCSNGTCYTELVSERQRTTYYKNSLNVDLSNKAKNDVLEDHKCDLRDILVYMAEDIRIVDVAIANSNKKIDTLTAIIKKLDKILSVLA